MKSLVKAGILALMAVVAYSGSHAGPIGGDPGNHPPGGGGGSITYYLTGQVTLTGLQPNKTYNATIESTLNVYEGNTKKTAHTDKIGTFVADNQGKHVIAGWKAGSWSGQAGSNVTHTLTHKVRLKNPSGKGIGASSVPYTYQVTLATGTTVYPVGGQEVIDCKDGGGFQPPGSQD